MAGQIVLCRGVNDGNELAYTIEQLSKYAPVMQSVSVVPVGLSKYREGLYPLEPFTKEDACEVYPGGARDAGGRKIRRIYPAGERRRYAAAAA